MPGNAAQNQTIYCVCVVVRRPPISIQPASHRYIHSSTRDAVRSAAHDGDAAGDGLPLLPKRGVVQRLVDLLAMQPHEAQVRRRRQARRAARRLAALLVRRHEFLHGGSEVDDRVEHVGRHRVLERVEVLADHRHELLGGRDAHVGAARAAGARQRVEPHVQRADDLLDLGRVAHARALAAVAVGNDGLVLGQLGVRQFGGAETEHGAAELEVPEAVVEVVPLEERAVRDGQNGSLLEPRQRILVLLPQAVVLTNVKVRVGALGIVLRALLIVVTRLVPIAIKAAAKTVGKSRKSAKREIGWANGLILTSSYFRVM